MADSSGGNNIHYTNYLKKYYFHKMIYIFADKMNLSD